MGLKKQRRADYAQWCPQGVAQPVTMGTQPQKGLCCKQAACQAPLRTWWHLSNWLLSTQPVWRFLFHHIVLPWESGMIKVTHIVCLVPLTSPAMTNPSLWDLTLACARILKDKQPWQQGL